jgi:solute carrier family 25 S-adenosylmethionine transporter 26
MTTWWHVPAAGGCAGVVVDLVLFPLDTLKTRLQARGALAAPVSAAAFYRGLASAMAGSFPAAATFWTAYEFARARADAAGAGAAAPALGAAAADVAVCAVRNPFEVVKQQLQSGMHADTRGAVRTILRTAGARGFYAGYLSTGAWRASARTAALKHTLIPPPPHSPISRARDPL